MRARPLLSPGRCRGGLGGHAAERRPSNARSGCRHTEARSHHGALRRTGQHAPCGRDCGEVKGRRGRGGRHGGASALASSLVRTAPKLTLIHLRFGLHRIHRHGEIGYRSTQGSHNCCKGSICKESGVSCALPGRIQMKARHGGQPERCAKAHCDLRSSHTAGCTTGGGPPLLLDGRQPLSRRMSVILRNKSRGPGLEVGLEQVEHALRLNVRHPATNRSRGRWRRNGWVDGSCYSLWGAIWGYRERVETGGAAEAKGQGTR